MVASMNTYVMTYIKQACIMLTKCLPQWDQNESIPKAKCYKLNSTSTH